MNRDGLLLETMSPPAPSEGTSTIGLALAMSSSLAIGASFIIKKKGLKRAAGRRSRRFRRLRLPPRAHVVDGTLTMILGEIANFAAYAFALAILTPSRRALSSSRGPAHHLLAEKLHLFGWLGCLLCIVGSVSIVLNAPEERQVSGVKELAALAARPGFVAYAAFVIGAAGYLARYVAPAHGNTQILVPIGICSLMGSLSVMSCKALGIALKLTFEGNNQLYDLETYACAATVACCVVTQMNYLNKALDVFNTAVVTPIYYVMFTTLTLIASSIMFQDYANQTAKEVMSQLCGFVTIPKSVHAARHEGRRAGRDGPPGSTRKREADREPGRDQGTEEMLRGVRCPVRT